MTTVWILVATYFAMSSGALFALSDEAFGADLPHLGRERAIRAYIAVICAAIALGGALIRVNA